MSTAFDGAADIIGSNPFLRELAILARLESQLNINKQFFQAINAQAKEDLKTQQAYVKADIARVMGNAFA